MSISANRIVFQMLHLLLYRLLHNTLYIQISNYIFGNIIYACLTNIILEGCNGFIIFPVKDLRNKWHVSLRRSWRSKASFCILFVNDYAISRRMEWFFRCLFQSLDFSDFIRIESPACYLICSWELEEGDSCFCQGH